MKAIFIFALFCFSLAVNAGGFITVDGVTYSDDQLKKHVNGMAIAGDVIGGLKTAGSILGDIFGADELKVNGKVVGKDILTILKDIFTADELHVNGKQVGKDILGVLKDIFLHNDELKRHVNGMAVAGDVISGLKTAGSILGDIFGNDELISKAGRDVLTILKDIFTEDELKKVNGMAVAGDVIGGLKTAGEILSHFFENDELISKAGRDILGVLKDIFLHNDELKRHVNGMAVAGDVIGGLKTAGSILGDIFGNDELISKAGRDVLTILKDIFTEDELKKVNGMAVAGDVIGGLKTAGEILSHFFENDELISKAGRDILGVLKDIFLHNDELKKVDEVIVNKTFLGF